MNSNYSYGGRSRYKEKMYMALICGPIFSIALFVFMYLATLIPETLHDSANYIIWPSAATGCGILATGADRLGKRFGLSPQEFAGPVAFSCAVCAAAAYALLWMLLGWMNT